MAQNFLACDRDQELLLPPSLREWLPERHLAWFVIDAVAALDLSAFYAPYRDNGQGRAAHDPAMMVALLLYSYAVGERSSRRIERRCVEDVATRVICANQAPDHTMDFPRFAGQGWAFELFLLDLLIWGCEPRSGEPGSGVDGSSVLVVGG
jgi:transposase